MHFLYVHGCSPHGFVRPLTCYGRVSRLHDPRDSSDKCVVQLLQGPDITDHTNQKTDHIDRRDVVVSRAISLEPSEPFIKMNKITAIL
jgi:hypothetical protein